MPNVELHADYDRNGVLSGTAAEYARRSSGHGAIVGVNIDSDGHALPATPRIRSPRALDFALATRRGGDDEPLQIRVVVAPSAVAAFTALTLRVTGDNAGAIQLLGDPARLIAPTLTRPGRADFPLPLRQGRHRFRVESVRVPGSPLGRANGALTVTIVGRDGTGAETEIDAARFLIARFLVIDDLAPAQALYMCETAENVASLNDVRAALRGVSPPVALRVVGPADNFNDAWIQDQFQLGCIVTPSRTIRAILHMPRFRRNSQVGPPQPNLAEVVRTHFPSADLGLIEDFWLRQINLPHRGGTTPVSFQLSEEGFRIFEKVRGTNAFLRAAIDQLCVSATRRSLPRPAECDGVPDETDSMPILRQQLPDLRRRVDALLRVLRPTASNAAETAQLDGIEVRTRARMSELERDLRVQVAGGLTTYHLALTGRTFLLDDLNLVEFSADVRRVHDSLVYGGNVEASPPFAGFPFGKIVLGESDERLIDPPVMDFFLSNADVQPVVTIDTSWLGVGHVDELIAFLPDRATSGHVILRASPEVAFALIDAAMNLYISGTRFPQDLLVHARHRTDHGTHPVTRMFRGHLWLHADPLPAPAVAGAPPPDLGEPHEPPHIYLAAAAFFRSPFFGMGPAPFSRTPGDHFYPAAFSLREVNEFEDGTNAAIVQQHLTPLDAILRREFPSFPILRVPVIFDRNDDERPTAAFTPNAVNLQFVNGKALIPNPFGPRMAPADAIQVVQQVLRDQGLGSVAASVTTAFLRRHRLNRLTLWINRAMGPTRVPNPFLTLTHIAEEFRDGFTRGMPLAEREGRIRRANRAHFDAAGSLRDGWRQLTIPEDTVDLFQAYTHAVLVSLGLQVAWIDSWFYHVRVGEIHCGTNVLRAVPAMRTPWWSRLPARP